MNNEPNDSDLTPLITDEQQGQAAIEVPYQQISASALQGLLEEFITREGTNYGEVEVSIDEQLNRAMLRLKCKEIKIMFYPDTQHCQLLEVL